MTNLAPGKQPLSTVLIAMSAPGEAISRLRARFPEVRFVVPGAHEPGDYSASPEEPDSADLLAADGIIAWGVPPEMLDAAPRLRWIHSGGAGVNSFDLPAIAARGITLTNSSGVAAPNMAEHVLAMMLALARRIPRLVREQAARSWRDHETHREVAELQGQSLLIVGTGDVGCAVAVRAAALGMQVSGVRRRHDGPLPIGFDVVVGTAALAEALPGADQVVLTLPDTPGTRGLFDGAAFAAMKPGALIYNVGRGAAINTDALIAALQRGQLGGAGLDVTDPEPLPPDSPLWEMENVLITSHTSGSTPRYWDRLTPLLEENIRRLQLGQTPLNVVDLEAGY